MRFTLFSLSFFKKICFHFIFFSDLDSSGWAKGYTAIDFELLCRDGTRAAVTEWAGCNLGPIPPSTVMTRPVTVTKIYDFLMKSQVRQETGKKLACYHLLCMTAENPFKIKSFMY